MPSVRFPPYNRSVFKAAVREGRIERVREIISSRYPYSAEKWNDGYSLLRTAVMKKHSEIAKLLLTSGSNVNSRCNPNSPLHYAVLNGDIEIVRMLLDRDANIHAKNRRGRTPLHNAVESMKTEIIRMLLNRNANINAADNRNLTPLHLVIIRGSKDIINLPLKRGANVYGRGNNATTSGHIVANRGDGSTTLRLAVDRANEEIIELLLNSGANVNAERNDGATPLHIAAERGSSKIVGYLLKYGANVNSMYTSTSREGDTSLHFAAERGSEEIVEMLLSRGADVNAKRKCGTTSLHLATQHGYLKIVECLLKHGAYIDSTSEKDPTPLYLAVENAHGKIVKLLLEYGANVNSKDNDDKTILHLAVEKGCSTIVEDILKHCPDLNDKSNSNVISVALRGYSIEYKKIVNYLLEYGSTANPKDANDFIHASIEKSYVNILEELLKYDADALHVAIKNRHEEAAKLLISYGVDVNAPDETGKTPIFYATENANVNIIKLLLTHKANVKDNPELLNIAVKDDVKEIVEVLLQHGADVNAVDKCGRMPLYFIVLDNEYKRFGDCHVKGEVAKLLLSRGANANTRINNDILCHWRGNANTTGENSITMLHAAVAKGYVKVVEALLEYNADVNSTFEDDTTPLHLAAKRGSEVITKILLNEGANINAEQRNGMTALLLATESGHKEVVELLLKYGAKIDAREKHNLMTPLHIAAKYNRLNVVKFLLKLGASVDSTDKSGTTPLHYACRKGYEDIVTVLLDHGSDISIKNKENYTALNFAMNEYNYNDSDYASDYHDFDRDIHENVVEVLERHMIKMRTANLYTSDDDALSISSSSSDDEELTDFEDIYDDVMKTRYNDCRQRRLSRNVFQDDCEKEIASMKSEMVANTNVTFYDILTKGVRQVAMYARNASIVGAFGSGDYRIKFPKYASMINSNFRIGEKRKDFLEEGNKIFCVLFNDLPGLPRDCIEGILSYLNEEDLNALKLSTLTSSLYIVNSPKNVIIASKRRGQS